jgi:hypothetical protein
MGPVLLAQAGSRREISEIAWVSNAWVPSLQCPMLSRGLVMIQMFAAPVPENLTTM